MRNIIYFSTLSKLDTHDPKSEPDLTILSTVQAADLLCHLWQTYSSGALLPLAGSSVTVRREMVAYNQTNLSRAEGKVNAIIQKLLDRTLPSSSSSSSAGFSKRSREFFLMFSSFLFNSPFFILLHDLKKNASDQRLALPPTQ